MAEDTDYEIDRQFPRHAFQKTPWIFALQITSKDLTATTLQLEAQNISLGGMRILSNKKIPIFTTVVVQLLDKEGKKPPLPLSGKVVRVDETDLGLDEKTFGMAVEFTKLPDKTLKILEAALSKL
jgi:hypothetical protein